ncbi:hypothetical protein MPAR168_00710 [Methylorubrum populi]
MNSGVRDHGEEAAETRGDAGDEPWSQSEFDAASIPANAPEADTTPTPGRTWDISDWFRIS